ncbi:aldo/keto reductase [Pseudoduganella namucuonensis]|uniref:Aldo/keto reductase n=1 Tax=Pseudoduganella namucuonensis TaxID=1035707 RepID=A0A1I7GTE1_9BURK|nr:aldo/keto reductase [Pseudoduganella namucuonensis]SFU51506.1 Aldo/keto reductase [Pseudoduganella namucuonensis]
MKTVQLSSGVGVPALGQGTWNMGETAAGRQREIAALQLGVDLGMTLIDTAEMYAEGGSEEVVGAAIAGRREQIYLVSKVYPHNASLAGVRAACERSLKRLKTDCLDLYLLHWRGSVPLEEMLEGFQALKRAGKIRDYGVSNFDLDDMHEARALPGGDGIVANQVLYNLAKRGIEWNLLPWSQRNDVPVMAYSPLESSAREQRAMLGNPGLRAVAERHGATPAQVALAWILRQDRVIAIPKASSPEHVRQNRAALDLALTPEDLAELDRAYPLPRRNSPLEMR